MQKNKITSRPPAKQSVHDFILEAENKTKIEKEEIKIILPWQTGKVRADVKKVFTVKLPEEYILKIKYISEITNKSQQKIVREIIQSEIDRVLKDTEA